MNVTVKITEQDFQKYRLATQEDVIESAGRISFLYTLKRKGN